MRAIVMQGGTSATLVTDRPVPQLRPGFILVQVAAVALNPTDWKHIHLHNRPNLLCGCDYAGTVAATGSGYTKAWQVGDRICGMAHGGNRSQEEDGAFAEWIVVKADVQMRIPPSMSFAEAATLGVGVLTAGQGLYQAMGLALPSIERIRTGDQTQSQDQSHRGYVLVYGGSTASGALGIQFLRASGYLPVTTCSPHHFDYLYSLGAVAAFDYHQDDCAREIKRYTQNTLRHAWDCICNPSSTRLCAEALADGGALRYGCLLPVEFPRLDVNVTHTLAYTAFGEPYDKGWAKLEAADTNDFEAARVWVDRVDKMLAGGIIKPHHLSIQAGGLDGILQGLAMLKDGAVSGQKLVYKLHESKV